MIKILQVLPSLSCCGGVENYLMNYYRKINKNSFHFDFAYHIEDEPNFIKEIIAFGGKIYKLPSFSMRNFSDIKKEIRRILTENEYDEIHCHQANAAFLYFKIAKQLNIKTRIIHSHQSKAADKLTHGLRNYPLLWLGVNRSTDYLACSKLAGDFLFRGKNYTIINNAIEPSKFSFNANYREEFRRKYHIGESEYVIGHIGRLCNQKNQLYFIDIAKELMSRGFSSFKVVMIGDGSLGDTIRERIKKEGLEDFFVLIGSIVDTYKSYNAFDIFVLPSLYEGLPVVGVEAQYNGLEVLTSTDVTKELNFSNRVSFIPLNNLSLWVNSILSSANNNDINARTVAPYKQFDINEQCKKLEKYYEMVKRDA